MISAQVTIMVAEDILECVITPPGCLMRLFNIPRVFRSLDS